jgi:GDP-4-dehydro-6-deoxy-D-mannose reductase
MTTLVTGASGFVGRRLVKALRQRLGTETRLIGWDHSADGESDDWIAGGDRVERNAVDLTDTAAVDAAVQLAPPTQIFHLAAISSVGQSQGAARATHEVNVAGTLNLAEALRKHAPGARLVFASSGEVYGSAFASGEPLAESAPLRPLNPYARSKLAAEFLLEDRLSDVCPIIALRLLNHIGPGQDEHFVVPGFAAQIARIERGLIPPKLMVGNLAAERDFLAVDDVIDAYLKMLALGDGKPGFSVYNVASGEPRSINSILERLTALSTAKFEIEPDPARLRPAEIARTLCDASAFRALTGWRPKRDVDQALEEILDWWRGRVGG